MTIDPPRPGARPWRRAQLPLKLPAVQPWGRSPEDLRRIVEATAEAAARHRERLEAQRRVVRGTL